MDARLPRAVSVIGERPLAGSRAVLVTGTFSPEVGYQEVDLARSLVRLGADVRVVTSTRPSRGARSVVRSDYPAGIDHENQFEIVRLRPKLTVGSNVLGCDVLPATRDFAPDHVVLIGPGKLFGVEVFSSPRAPWTRTAIFQENSHDGRSSGSLARRFLRSSVYVVFKRPAFRRVVRHADRIVLNVPETREVLAASLRAPERERLFAIALDLRLGFDPQAFFFDPEGRQRFRDAHGVGADEILLVTCTRVTRGKHLSEIIDAISSVRSRGFAVRYALAGLVNDHHGDAVRSLVSAQPEPGAFLLLPMLGHDEMRELLSAADLGVWPQAAITIQQAMGTGLPVVLRHEPTVSHLLVHGENGWYGRSGRRFDEAIMAAVSYFTEASVAQRLAQRQQRAHDNAGYLSYDRLALQILAGLPTTYAGKPAASHT